MYHEAQYVFEVKEDGNGRPWVACNSHGPDLPILKGHLLGIHLKSVKLEDAQGVAKFLNDNIRSFFYSE